MFITTAVFPGPSVGVERRSIRRLDVPRKRPLLLRLAPNRFRNALYYRCYRQRRANWRHLYYSAPLQFAPQFRMNLSPTDEGHSDIAFTGVYEMELSSRMASLREEGGLMVDVGANYGYFSLLWAAGSPQNRVIALEASPRNQPALRKNVALNRAESQIEVRGVAVGAEAGTLEFSLGNEEQTGWGGFSNSPADVTVPVDVVTLDSVVAPDETVSVLKIDVEGADTWVLYGAEKLLAEKRIRHLFFEENLDRMARLGIQQGAASSFLSRLGYKVTAMGDPTCGLVEYHAEPARRS